MVIEYARNVAGLEKAASTEFDPDCPEPVIATMEEQKSFVDGAGDLGGTMRLGLYPALLSEGTVVREAYAEAAIAERHRHRYEVNNHYREQLEAAGLVFSGTNPDLGLVEFVELPREVHPYYVSTQAHPELRSRPTRPHPLFAGLIGAAIERQRELRFPIDESGLRRLDDDRPDRQRTAGSASAGAQHPAPGCRRPSKRWSGRSGPGPAPSATCRARSRNAASPTVGTSSGPGSSRPACRHRRSAHHLVEVATRRRAAAGRAGPGARSTGPARAAGLPRAPTACRRPAPTPRPWRRGRGAPRSPRARGPRRPGRGRVPRGLRPPPSRTTRGRRAGRAPARRGRCRRPRRPRAGQSAPARTPPRPACAAPPRGGPGARPARPRSRPAARAGAGCGEMGVHWSAARRARPRKGSTTAGLRSDVSTSRTQVSRSSAASSPLTSMSQAVETPRARESGSGRSPARSRSVCSDASSVRTAAKVRSPSLTQVQVGLGQVGNGRAQARGLDRGGRRP